MKKVFCKKLLALLVCMTLMLTAMIAVAPSVSAASYPFVTLDMDLVNTYYYAGDTISLEFDYWPEYHNEKIHLEIYDPYGDLVATSDKQVYNADGSYIYKDYTVTWDTTDYTSGTYQIYIWLEYYSLMAWRESPSTRTYYINLKPASERPTTGWYLIGSKWAYYRNGVKVTNSWVADSQGWCYLGEDGFAVTNAWQNDSKGRCYLDSNGRMVKNKWIKVDGSWYCMDAKGYCVTNSWMKDSIGWCYLGSDGKMATNKWLKDSKGWCYVGAGGYCLTNTWVKDSAGWCYLDSNGRMATNKWIKDTQGWCYVGANGYCVTNSWMKDSIGWCYLDAEGRMVTNQWLKDSTGLCYIGPDGYCLTGVQIIDGVRYEFDNTGVLIK